jgi:hypothetical protein
MSYGKWEPCEDTQCPKCMGYQVNCRSWDSSDEAHTDYQFECVNCQNTWWIEGTDA